jgi:hypothetical protein
MYVSNEVMEFGVATFSVIGLLWSAKVVAVYVTNKVTDTIDWFRARRTAQ